MPYAHTRRQQTYDHRLRDLVRTTGDPDILAELGVPRSTALGWLRKDYPPVVTADVLDMDHIRLQAEVLKLRQRNRTLAAVVRLRLALVRALGGRLERRRLPEGPAKARLLRAIERTEDILSLQTVLRIVGLSASRYHPCRQAEHTCGLDDQPTCPRFTPTRLTAAEILAMNQMVESPAGIPARAHWPARHPRPASRHGVRRSRVLVKAGPQPRLAPAPYPRSPGGPEGRRAGLSA